MKSLRVLHDLEPSLRIVPLSDQILTAAAMTASTERLYEEFPAYSSVLLRLAIVNLRTVIVTAAVHWGFSSKLHPLISDPNCGSRRQAPGVRILIFLKPEA